MDKQSETEIRAGIRMDNIVTWIKLVFLEDGFKAPMSKEDKENAHDSIS